jgi:GntR family transcriptional regulator
VPADPAYLRIAADLRARIFAGELGPGEKLPTETELMAAHGVSRTVAKWAISVLKGEGLVEGRRGSGVYVRTVRRLTREAHGPTLRAETRSGSPFARDAARAGRQGGWEHRSAHDVADERIAARLAIEPGAAVMRTAYRFVADGEPIQLSTSWEPLSITGGTAVEWPEGEVSTDQRASADQRASVGHLASAGQRPSAGQRVPEDGSRPAVGVVARMDLIGVHVDEFVERVTARPAGPAEAEALRLPARGMLLLAIERTYLAAGVPVETADIVFPGDRYELVYRVPVY